MKILSCLKLILENVSVYLPFFFNHMKFLLKM